jgi:hypothetical protein
MKKINLHFLWVDLGYGRQKSVSYDQNAERWKQTGWFDVHLWDELKLMQLWDDSFAVLKQKLGSVVDETLLQRLPKGMFLVDWFRLLVLYVYGGIYVDYDVQFRYSSKLYEMKVKCEKEPEKLILLDHFNNWFIGAIQPQNPILLQYMARSLDRMLHHPLRYLTFTHFAVLFITGPLCLRSTFRSLTRSQQKDSVLLLSSNEYGLEHKGDGNWCFSVFYVFDAIVLLLVGYLVFRLFMFIS